MTHHRVEVLCSRIAKKDLWQFPKVQGISSFLRLYPVFRFVRPVIKTIPHAIISTTIVLIAVARFEFMSLIPIFASIDVSAAKNADSIA